MGFVLEKVLLFLILPPAGMLVLIGVGLVLIRRHPNVGKGLTGLGFILLYAASLPAVADMLMRPLESYAPPFSGTREHVDAVVVLGGGVRDLSWVPAPAAPTETALERLVTGIGIARSLKVPLVISGGTGEISGSSVKEADAMVDAAERIGFPRKSILAENRSRNTLENAEAVSTLISGRTIVLATSAFHMRRAAEFFRRKGFQVIPSPTAYRAQSRPHSWTNLLPRAENLAISSTAIAERLSLLWYGI